MNTWDDSESSRKRRRSKSEKIRDRARISALYLRGKLQHEIAEELDLSQSTVSRHIQELQTEWEEKAVLNIDTAKAKELAKVDQLELTYWAAWERSRENAEVDITEQISNRVDGKEAQQEVKDGAISPERVKKTKRVEGQSGNPSFLGGVQWCINKRCEILGLNAPTKVAPTNIAGDKEYQISALTDDERALRIIALLKSTDVKDG